ncbi:MAG: 2-oxo-4-hydroxy-4-carboxy-5-ureidoimidazoline decarboxylase, partial [Nodosilinea sp.]
MAYTLNQINQMTQEQFITALGPTFEQTPGIAAQTWNLRPFATLRDLHHHMVGILRTMTTEDQRTLIRAHPDLGSRIAMAEASAMEQNQAGLTHLSPEEYHQLQHLNQQYQEIFGFPFILAVAGHDKEYVLEAITKRVANPAIVEFNQALREIEIIAQLRLQR